MVIDKLSKNYYIQSQSYYFMAEAPRHLDSPFRAVVDLVHRNLVHPYLTYGGATLAETYADFVRKPTSTPNYTIYPLRDLAAAMRAYGMKNMDDFRELRGKHVHFPLK